MYAVKIDKENYKKMMKRETAFLKSRDEYKRQMYLLRFQTIYCYQVSCVCRIYKTMI